MQSKKVHSHNVFNNILEKVPIGVKIYCKGFLDRLQLLPLTGGLSYLWDARPAGTAC